MPSFQITVTPSRRAAARFIETVRRMLQKTLVEENKKSGLTQSEIARKILVHRSVISRELHGYENITLGRVGELAWAMGRRAAITFPEIAAKQGSNIQSIQTTPPTATDGEISVDTRLGVRLLVS